MKITRKIETTNAKYTLEELSDHQFRFLISAVNYYTQYTHHCIPDKDTPIGELVAKLDKMKESSVTIIS